MRAKGFNLPAIELPLSVEDARERQARRFSELIAAGQPQAEDLASPVMHTPIERAAIAAEDELQECDDAYIVDGSGGPSQALAAGAIEEESDNESVATNTPQDHDEDSNEFDFVALQGTSKAAFDEQAVARVFYEMEGAAPKLGELAAYLKQFNSLRQHDDIVRAVTFRNSLNSLQHELGRLIGNYSESNSSNHAIRPQSTPRPTATQPPTSQQLRGSKRSVNDILGASPEKASKRKQSYRPH